MIIRLVCIKRKGYILINELINMTKTHAERHISL